MFAWTDRACLPLMTVAAAVATALNYYAAHNFHTIEKHLVFRERILHGFATTDVVPGYAIPPTFPDVGIRVRLGADDEQTAADRAPVRRRVIFSAWYFLRVVDESGLVDEWSRFWLRCLHDVLRAVDCAYHSID